MEPGTLTITFDGTNKVGSQLNVSDLLYKWLLVCSSDTRLVKAPNKPNHFKSQTTIALDFTELHHAVLGVALNSRPTLLTLQQDQEPNTKRH